MDAQTYPRFLGHQLKTQLTATVVGKLLDLNKKKNSLQVQTDPEAKIVVEILVGEEDLDSFEIGSYYECRGVCRGSKQIDLRSYTKFGHDFDIGSYNQMLQLASREFRQLFYP